MEARVYLDRLRAVSSYEHKASLLKDLMDAENATRETFAQTRRAIEVSGVEDPFLSMVWVHGEDTDLMAYQHQVRESGQRGPPGPARRCPVGVDFVG